jgi:hypothetical protein
MLKIQCLKICKIDQIEFLQEKPWIFTGGIADRDSDVIYSLLTFALKQYKAMAKEYGMKIV